MFHNRPCGCKGKRTCLKCEEQYGAWNTFQGFSEKEKEESVVYCPHCDLAWPGYALDSWQQHPNHRGNPRKVAGVKVILDFVSKNEEHQLLQQLDEVPWDTSQSGRLKQNYGPKCNFKKRKVKLDGFTGYPQFTEFLQQRFDSMNLLKDFQTVEQCSLDYTPCRGAAIDPHIDDCWIWGERIPTLSLMSDSGLTLTKYTGSPDRYNLRDVQSYPSIVDEIGNPKTIQTLKVFYDNLDDKDESNINSEALPKNNLEKDICNDSFSSINLEKSNVLNSQFTESADSLSERKEDLPYLVRIPMPRCSLIVLYGSARYDYEHSILREDLPERRVCITYRELTPTFFSCGPKAHIGQLILNQAKHFWNHTQIYPIETKNDHGNSNAVDSKIDLVKCNNS